MSIIIVFLQKAIAQGIAILYGANGEILTEKSGNLNLGVPGMMYMGGVAGLIGAFLYENSAANPSPIVGMLIALLCALVCSGLGALLYSVLTISLRANQNVTGLALTTFGMGFGNFFGGSLSKLAGGVGQISTKVTASAFRAKIPFLSNLPVVGELLFSYGFLTYFAIIATIILSWMIYRTRVGLNLRAVGENPGTADAAGINVPLYKYLSTCIGGMLAGLGGLYLDVFLQLGEHVRVTGAVGLGEHVRGLHRHQHMVILINDTRHGTTAPWPRRAARLRCLRAGTAPGCPPGPRSGRPRTFQ